MPSRNRRSIPKSRHGKHLGFTLVELLVVITIIGILIALLLPAVQSSREAARRIECINHLKQMALAVNSHVEIMGVFPTGGAMPWPDIANYSTGGSPWGPKKQALGWAFQILPYLELSSIYGLKTQTKLEQCDIGLFFCPSRRPVTRYPDTSRRVLMDYAGITAGDPPSIIKDDPGKLDTSYWQGDHWNPPHNKQWHGAIVRTNWDYSLNPPGPVGSTKPINFMDITDGASNTAMLGEKRLHPRNYQSGDWHDDRGWSDGWDPDTIRSSSFPPGEDTDQNAVGILNQQLDIAYCLGSAHSIGFNSAFADGSVHTLNYEIDRDTLSYLGHREDGRSIDGNKF
jgi:prepilin-type N-terminal cleavage/methylation domain-containing protein